MVFNLFNKKEESKVYDGKIITEDELKEMIDLKNDSLFIEELNEVNSKLVELKDLIENGRK